MLQAWEQLIPQFIVNGVIFLRDSVMTSNLIQNTHLYITKITQLSTFQNRGRVVFFKFVEDDTTEGKAFLSVPLLHQPSTNAIPLFFILKSVA